MSSPPVRSERPRGPTGTRSSSTRRLRCKPATSRPSPTPPRFRPWSRRRSWKQPDVTGATSIRRSRATQARCSTTTPKTSSSCDFARDQCLDAEVAVGRTWGRAPRPQISPGESGDAGCETSGRAWPDRRAARFLAVLGDVDHRAVRVTHEEATQSPLLFGEWIEDLGPGLAGALEHLFHVIYLDRHVRMDVGLDVQLHHAQLNLALVGAEEEDPVEPFTFLEADHVDVEGSALVESVRQDIRLDPLHGHVRTLDRPPGRSRGVLPNIYRALSPRRPVCRRYASVAPKPAERSRFRVNEAAGVGFEPTGDLSAASGFQDRPVRPLRHPAVV